MALFNYTTKEITIKVVYYGPGLSGKTTNLHHLHSIMNSDRKGKLVSLPTETDRTLFFDLLPIEYGKIRDFSVRVQLYTVPGQVRYNATRKLVLKGADAVIFVADSQREMKEQNVESFKNMRENLIANNINPDEIPVTLQYNKRDLRNILSVYELNKDLNDTDRYGYIEAIAVNGIGVEDSFQRITKLVVDDIKRRQGIEIEPLEEFVQDAGSKETSSGIDIGEPFHKEPAAIKKKIESTRYEPFDFDLKKEPVLTKEPPVKEEKEITFVLEKLDTIINTINEISGTLKELNKGLKEVIKEQKEINPRLKEISKSLEKSEKKKSWF